MWVLRMTKRLLITLNNKKWAPSERSPTGINMFRWVCTFIATLSISCSAIANSSLEKSAFSVMENYIAKQFMSPEMLPLNGLLKQVRLLEKEKKFNDAALLLLAHATTIIHSQDDPDHMLLLDYLVRSHGVVLVDNARKELESIDPEGALKLAVAQAKYYVSIENPNHALALLSNDAALDTLPEAVQSGAWLAKGQALQQLKKHRDAIHYYHKVTVDSPHYRLAKLNQATAFIRQEWWTDAQAAIHDALKVNLKAKRDELDYRLYTFLGYSQLHFGFYRDARESFRHISVNSQYMSKALMGLGLAALHQEDFVGAYNAFQQFVTLSIDDMNAVEAKLLSAFCLQQLRSHEKASMAYESATQLFEEKLSVLSQSGQLLRKENQRDAMLLKIGRTLALIDHLEEKQPSTELIIARQQLNEARTKRLQHMLASEKIALESYLSQARFGIASLLDTVE
jgi:tetratricopeptide (TPR) repeat protein